MFSTITLCQISALHTQDSPNSFILFKNFPLVHRKSATVSLVGPHQVSDKLCKLLLVRENASPSSAQRFTNQECMGADELVIDWMHCEDYGDKHTLLCLIDNGICFSVSLPHNPKHGTTKQMSSHSSYWDYMANSTSHECKHVAAATEFLYKMRSQYFHLLASPSINIQTYMYMYISQACPTGTPLYADMYHVHQLLTKHFKPYSHLDHPAWNPPLDYLPKNFINLTIKEHYSCVQYDDEQLPDTYFAHGSIKCLSDLTAAHHIVANLTKLHRVTNLHFHHTCTDTPVQYSHGEAAEILSQNTSAPTTMHFQFIPSTGLYSLCRYTINIPAQGSFQPPIRGFYQVQQITKCKFQLLLQLKLSSEYNNLMEYCNVELPFENRARIRRDTIKGSIDASEGEVSLSPDAHCLYWKIGKKIEDTSLEVSLSGELLLEREDPHFGDPFFVHTNAYAKLNFKLLENTISGMDIEAQISSAETQLNIRKEILSSTVLVWNSHGDSKRAKEPVHILQEESVNED